MCGYIKTCCLLVKGFNDEMKRASFWVHSLLPARSSEREWAWGLPFAPESIEPPRGSATTSSFFFFPYFFPLALPSAFPQGFRGSQSEDQKFHPREIVPRQVRSPEHLLDSWNSTDLRSYSQNSETGRELKFQPTGSTIFFLSLIYYHLISLFVGFFWCQDQPRKVPLPSNHPRVPLDLEEPSLGFQSASFQDQSDPTGILLSIAWYLNTL